MNKHAETRWLLRALLIGCVVAICVQVATFLHKRANGIVEDGDAVPIAERRSEAEWAELLQQQADASHLRFSINTAPTVDQNGEIDWMLENAVENHMELRAEVTLEQDGRLIYQSPALPPGGQVLSAPPLVTLPAGEHQAQATLRAHDMESGEVVGQATVALTITVTE